MLNNSVLLSSFDTKFLGQMQTVQFRLTLFRDKKMMDLYLYKQHHLQSAQKQSHFHRL